MAVEASIRTQSRQPGAERDSQSRTGARCAFQRGLGSHRGGPPPGLPQGTTASEKRGQRFFEDVFDPQNLKAGSCAICHSGPMLDRTNQFFPAPSVGSRFQNVAISEFNEAKNPVKTFLFHNPDGSETRIVSPAPGRA